jgi:FixJ family two-component response regulator
MVPEPSRTYAGLTALVADDDPAVRIALRSMLRQLGFEVEMAADGQSALDAASRRCFALVLTDLAMPGMSGLDFLREARDHGLTAPVVVLTATGSVPKAVEAIKAGAFHFLEKPLRAGDLKSIVEAAMASRGSDHGSASGAVRVDPMAQTTRAALPADATLASPSQRGARESPATPGSGKRAAASSPISVDPTPDATTTSRRIGRYEVLARIGRGGMGTVYSCRDPLLGRTVALKVLDLFSDAPEQVEEMIARFRREAAAAATLAHPNIVSIYDLGHDEERNEWFIVMELLPGRALGAVFAEKGSFADPEVVRLGFQLADALAYAHARGVIHRDVKPSNILVGADGAPKLVDFGLAALEGWDVTQSGRVLGSPSYMPPERIHGKAGGPGVDQFSLGVVLYEAATGKNPFDAPTPEARLGSVLFHQPPPLVDCTMLASQALSQAVQRMMAKDDSARFPTMDAVANEFLRLGQDAGLALKRHLVPS